MDAQTFADIGRFTRIRAERDQPRVTKEHSLRNSFPGTPFDLRAN